ncbi:MAG: M20/M25/M40 family metallo-hydrolase [Chitinophagaceae bacterium]|jgi:acetylornithine deacetylase/succinyl-diaminopimelate desuccinylase-like protein|nr:M20/M25/M40 family metallo-hydrolase [Chitinophagaceae bacterium]
MSVAICCTHFLLAQTPQLLKVRKHFENNQHAIINEFVSFLSIPNIASDSPNIRKNAEFIMSAMSNRGIQNVQLLFPTTTKAVPAVYGEVIIPGATQTIIFYAHYDGQPVIPAQWAKGLSPFTPVLMSESMEKGGSIINFPTTQAYDLQNRIYARGASDDKAGVMAILNAYDALMKTGLKPTVNIKFFFEGEEEAGSDHLHEIFQNYSSLLKSDLWIICDGPVHQSGFKQVVFGVRGDAHVDITVYGSKRPLHSGHYGNWAPSPPMMLVKLLASMKDENGKVTIKGFYDDVIPLTAAEKKALALVPLVDVQMKKELGFPEQEMKGISLAEAISLPSLNINGIQSGGVGKNASNVITTSATAVLDLRLVAGNDYQRQQQKVIAHIKAQGYYVIDREPTEEERSKYSKIAKVTLSSGYNAQKTQMDLPIAQKVIAAVQSTTSEQVVLIPTAGGSLPLYVFEKYLNAKTISVPIANHDNNQHAENENIRLLNFRNGIETFAALMMMK